MARPAEHDEDEDDASPAPGHGIGHYLMLVLPPVIALLALVFAMIALGGTRSIRMELDNNRAEIKKTDAELASSRIELAKFKNAIQQEKSRQEETSKKQAELDKQIIQNLTRLQVKMRIHPTLEEQLQQAAGAASAVPATKAGPAGKKGDPQVNAIINAIKQFNKQ